MKQEELNSIFTHKLSYVDKFIQEPLSEAEILDLQDVFLTNGIHQLQVSSQLVGRRLVEAFLRSLDCYYATACLTSAIEPLPASVLDLYTEIARYMIHVDTVVDIEEFLIERFYVDFLWIEVSQELEQASWYSEFVQKLSDLKVTTHIPIVLLKDS